MIRYNIKKYTILNKTYKKLQKFKRSLRYKYLKSVRKEKYPEILSKIYNKRTGRVLDWNNIKTYNEKMQWAKLYENSEIKSNLTDKYLVREWVTKKIGKEYLIPLLGVWETFDEIDFKLLPNQFVLKTTHASGTNLIVVDKEKLDMKKTKKMFNRWININYAYSNALELHYNAIKPKIIAEEYIAEINGELYDYKFLCFNGTPHYCWIDKDRFKDHRRNIYNLNWELQDWQQHTYKNTDKEIEKPKNFELMLTLAENLCKDFSHVRVDFYNIEGKIFFGEMTFTNGNGFEIITPEKYNLLLGDLWKLPIDNKVKENERAIK